MRQACLQGLIDPCRADLLNRKWWWQLDRVLNYLEDRNQVQVMQLLHDRHCSAVDYLTDQNTFNHHWDWAGKLQSKIAQILLPWVPILDRKSQIQAMNAEWESRWGKLDDPATIKKIEDACAQMRKLAASGRKKSGAR